jgi:hypothetical protein
MQKKPCSGPIDVDHGDLSKEKGGPVGSDSCASTSRHELEAVISLAMNNSNSNSNSNDVTTASC